MSDRDTLDDLRQMNIEWLTWQEVCKELTALGVDINKENPLALVLQRWGEEMAELRCQQSRELQQKALKERRAAYVIHG